MKPLDPYVHGAESLIKYLPQDREIRGAIIGVWTGDDAAALFRGLPLLRRLYLVDDWSFRGVPAPAAAAYTVDQVRDSAKARLSLYHKRCEWLEMESAAAVLQPRISDLDFAYIDADHERHAVELDIYRWRDVVKAGGILAGHDYDHPDFPGVKQAVDAAGFSNLHIEGTVWRTIV